MPEAIEDPELLYDDTEDPEFKDERPRVQAPVAISGGPVNGNVDEVTGAVPAPGPVVAVAPPSAGPAMAGASMVPRSVMSPPPVERVSSVTIPTSQPRVQPPGGLNQIFGSMPLQQAEKAISTAMRFQGVRQYQNMLAQGKTPAEAMMAAAPLIFGGKQPNASVMRAAAPPTKRVQHINNRLYEQQSDGQWVPVTPEIPVRLTAPRTDPYDKSEFDSVQRSMRDIETRISNGEVVDRQIPAANKRLSDLRAQAQAIRSRAPSPATSTSSAPAIPSASAPAQKFTEGQLIRNKTTGKMFKIVNGKPVPAE